MIAIYFWFPLFIFCAFSLVSSSLEIGFLAIFLYYFWQLINKIYNSQNPQKFNQKVPIDYSSSNGIPNHTQQKNVEKSLIIDKIKSNLLSKWHFLAILVFSFLANFIIGFIPLFTFFFKTILFTGFPIETLLIYLNLLILGLFVSLVFFGIQNRINSILLGIILIISLFWSLGNLYNVNTYLNFANFSTCEDFRMLSDRGYLEYFPNKEELIYTSSIGEIKKLPNQIEIKISQYDAKDFKVEKIGEISKLDKIKSCLIPIFENKKVILI